MAGYCTLVLYFHSPTARENTAAHSCNIQPYYLLYHQIIDLLGLRMRMMPRAALCQCAFTTLHNVLSSFELSLVLFLPSQLLLYIDFVAFSFSMPPIVGYVQYLTPQNTYVAEDQPRCPTLPRLSRSAVFPCPLSLGQAQYKRIWYPRELVHVTHESIYIAACT